MPASPPDLARSPAATPIPPMTDTFPSTLVGPSSKERKYDRQLRLWAASGQQSLEGSRVLLVNSDGPWDKQNSGVSGVAGVETLKNLVLPGVGGFTIVDPAQVTEPDLGVNFFLEEESLGKPRAEETCRLLRELNPDVEGSFHSKVYISGSILECMLS
jgi:amyloid beta precursor protein binding protein 1